MAMQVATVRRALLGLAIASFASTVGLWVSGGFFVSLVYALLAGRLRLLADRGVLHYDRLALALEISQAEAERLSLADWLAGEPLRGMLQWSYVPVLLAVANGVITLWMWWGLRRRA